MAETTKNKELKTKNTKEKTTVVKQKPQNEAKATKNESALSVEAFDVTGKTVGTVDLPQDVFGVKVNKELLAQAVRVYLANQRAGSASTKTRGQVQGSTKKIYRQKGTGRARHGAVRAPIFVHGGIAHGPKPHDFHMDMPQKMRKAALFSALSLQAQRKHIKVLQGLDTIEAKTKMAKSLLSQIVPEANKIKILLVLDKKYDNVIRAFRNIEGITYEYANQLHAYNVMNFRTIIFMEPALSSIKVTKEKKVNE